MKAMSRQIAVIKLPYMTPELEDIIQAYKNSWDPFNHQLVYLMMLDMVQSGKMNIDDAKRMWAENFRKVPKPVVDETDIVMRFRKEQKP